MIQLDFETKEMKAAMVASVQVMHIVVQQDNDSG